MTLPQLAELYDAQAIKLRQCEAEIKRLRLSFKQMGLYLASSATIAKINSDEIGCSEVVQ